MNGKRSRTVRIVDDDRARIPFAMIGVLLLVSSVAVVVAIDSRPAPETDVDTSVAMDRSVAASKTAVEDAVTTATDAAAREPLTSTADTPAGKAIDDISPVIAGDTEDYDVFGPYVRLRSYLEARESLQTAGQDLDGETRTEVSIPPVNYTESNIEKAIERVDLDVGRYDPDLETGTVRATIEDVRIDVYRDGERVLRQTRDVSTVVGTTVFELHERTQTYEDRLEMGFFEGGLDDIRGFGQRVALRLYPLAWTKATIERPNGLPDPTPAGAYAYKSMLENYEIETLANDAIYNVQEDVYGSRDPRSHRAMKGAWACMAAKTGQKLFNARRSKGKSGSSGSSGTSSSGSSGSSPGSSGSSGGSSSGSSSGSGLAMISGSGVADELCRATKFLFGDVEASPATSLQDIIEGGLGGSPNSPLEKEQTFKMELFAEPAYAEITDGDRPKLEDLHSDVSESDREKADDTAEKQSEDRDEYDRSGPEFDAEDRASAVVDQIYQVEGETEYDSIGRSGGSLPSASPPSGGGWGVDDARMSIRNVDKTVNHREVATDESGDPRTIHVIDLEITNSYQEIVRWEKAVNCTEEGCSWKRKTTRSSTKRISFSTTIRVNAEHALGSDVTDRGLDRAYEPDGAPAGENLEPVLDATLEDLVHADPDNVESDLASSFYAGGIRDEGDFASRLDSHLTDSKTFGADVMLTSDQRANLEDWLGEQLAATHGDLTDDVGDTKITRMDLLSSNRPFQEIRDKIDDETYIYESGGPYPTPAHKARAELNQEYVSNVYAWMDKVREQQQAGQDIINDKLSDAEGAGDAALSDTLGFAQRAMDFDYPESRTELDGSPLLENVTFEIDGSPTYLSLAPVTRATVPDVRPSYGSVADAGDDVNADHAPMATRNQAWLPNPGLPVIPWPTYWYASVNNVDVDIKGEYARFAVTANATGPSATTATSYVRQEQPITLEINEQERTVGTVDPVDFESETYVFLVQPGFNALPKGTWGVGDRTLPTSTKHRLEECSKTWDHAGTDFDIGDVAYEKCANLKGDGSNAFEISQYVGGDEFESVEVELEVLDPSDRDDEIIDIDADDDGAFVDECDDETLLDAMGDAGKERFDDLDDGEQGAVVEHFCRLKENDVDPDQGELRAQFAELVSHDDEVASTWIQMVIHQDQSAIEQALEYVADLHPAHDLEGFLSAKAVNNMEDGEPSHKKETIVTKFETGTDTEYARIYGHRDGDYVSGSWVTKKEDVKNKDETDITEDLALWDLDVVTEPGLAWADYECVVKVYVPEGEEMYVSTTSAFSAWDHPIDERLPGGSRQFKIVNFPEDDGEPVPLAEEDHRWVPLGSIEEFAEDPGALDAKWRRASPGDNLAEGRCG